MLIIQFEGQHDLNLHPDAITMVLTKNILQEDCAQLGDERLRASSYLVWWLFTRVSWAHLSAVPLFRNH
jgi:hypothetical protein